ncbi:hypothetical protein DYB37_004899 [Aphanomyces astaci]|uniref:Uncharacterized protein n=1 Tax=Aphanomyces astaci TaxID=112090 RepID=A0A418F115_APHAT|nr:hypothetical protein DYB37_004899 [Aphanomyces astaci]
MRGPVDVDTGRPRSLCAGSMGGIQGYASRRLRICRGGPRKGRGLQGHRGGTARQGRRALGISPSRTQTTHQHLEK